MEDFSLEAVEVLYLIVYQHVNRTLIFNYFELNVQRGMRFVSTAPTSKSEFRFVASLREKQCVKKGRGNSEGLDGRAAARAAASRVSVCVPGDRGFASRSVVGGHEGDE